MKKKRRKVLSALTAMCVLAGAMFPYTDGLGTGTSAADLTGGLVGYWDFDGGALENEGSGDYTAAIEGSGVTLNEDGGVSGGSAYFSQDGSSHIRIGSIVDASEDDYSVSLWIKYDTDAFDSISGNMSLLQQSGDGRTMLLLSSSLYYGTYLTGSSSACTKATELGQWTHVVFTCNHSTQAVQFYLNGELANENTLSGSFVSGVTDLLVGSHKSTSQGNAIKGTMDELRFYNKVIDADTVSALYEQYAISREYGLLKSLAAEAEELENGSDEAAALVAQKIEAANALQEGTATLEEVRSAYSELQSAVEAYRSTIKVGISVDTTDELREICDAMFGVNHRYANDGYSSWNAEEGAIEEEFDTYVKEASLGSVRYPGGTVANLYDWKRAIGEVSERKKTVHGLPDNNDPVSPNFGVDEAMSWIYDDLGAEAIWVYGMGQGSASDIADLFEYLNAPNDGSNPNGGTDWAAVRAANGHEEPYGVTRFEIGNEIGYSSQTYWIDGRDTSAQTVTEAYVEGGLMSFGSSTKTVQDENWKPAAAASDGTANQVRYVKYDPVVEDSIRVYVGGTEWTTIKVEETEGADSGVADANALEALAAYGPNDTVCVVEYPSGKIVFGDGVNGKIPTEDEDITASYQTQQDGFVDYYDALKDIAEQLDMEVEVYSCIYWNSFVTTMDENGYNDKYDGIVIHPYAELSGAGISADDELLYEKVLGRSLEHNVTRVQSLAELMEETTGSSDKKVAVSEFGINTKSVVTRSMGQAIYIANEMIDYVNLGAAYINKHCLVDYYGKSDTVGIGDQAIIQVYENDDGSVDFVATPSAKVFEVFNSMSGSIEVGQTITDNTVFYTYTATDGTKYDVPSIKAISTKDEEGNVYVIAVNNERSNSITISLTVDDRDLEGTEVSLKYVTSDSPVSENTQDNPDNVVVETATVTAAGAALEYTLEPHSVTGFMIPAEKTETPEETEEPETQETDTTGGDNQTEVPQTEETSQQAETKAPADSSGNSSDGNNTDASTKDANSAVDGESSTGTTAVKVAKPTSLKAKRTAKGVRLTWKKVSGATGYIIYRSSKKKSGYKKVATVKTNKKLYLDKKAKSGKKWYYRIRAYRTVDGKKITSSYSKTVAVKK